jgi:hypothetical protein
MQMLKMQMHPVVEIGREVMTGVGVCRTFRQNGPTDIGEEAVDMLGIPRWIVRELSLRR